MGFYWFVFFKLLISLKILSVPNTDKPGFSAPLFSGMCWSWLSYFWKERLSLDCPREPLLDCSRYLTCPFVHITHTLGTLILQVEQKQQHGRVTQRSIINYFRQQSYCSYLSIKMFYSRNILCITLYQHIIVNHSIHLIL